MIDRTMNKLGFAIAVCVLLCSLPVFSQNDTASFVAGKWSSETIADGIVLKQCHFDNGELFGSNQFISVLEVAPSRRIDIVADTILRKTTDFASSVMAVAAVNGSFFNMKYPYNSVDYLRMDGSVRADNVKSSTNIRQRHQLGAIATFAGELYVLKADALWSWEKYIQSEDVLTSGPLLICDDTMEPMIDDSFYTTRHPRTSVGKRIDGTVLLVVVDGRNIEAAGMSLAELQSVMKWLGCIDAINLDGGGSSTMVVKGLIVNHPTDNKLFDAGGERSVANAVVVR